MSLRRLPLFVLLGVPLRVDSASLVAVLLLLPWTLAEATMPMLVPEVADTGAAVAYWGMALAATLGLALSLVLREALAILAARRAGIPLRGVTLFPFGGVAETAPTAPARVRDELAHAASALLVSLALAALAVLLFTSFGGPDVPLTVLAWRWCWRC